MGVLGVMWCYRVNKWLFSPSLEWWVVMMMQNKVFYMMWMVSQQNSDFKFNIFPEYLFKFKLFVQIQIFRGFPSHLKKNPKFMLYSKEKICIATLQCVPSAGLKWYFSLSPPRSTIWGLEVITNKFHMYYWITETNIR